MLLESTKFLYVLIASYNGENFIDACLNSINNFSKVNSDLKVYCIFVDDGSTDNTTKKVEYFQEKSNAFTFMYLFKPNGGLSNARNFGLKYIKDMYSNDTPYVLFLDIDDILLPSKISINDNYELNIFNYQINDRNINLKKNSVGKLSQYNPFVVSCIISKIDDTFFDEKLTSLEDWDYWITRMLDKQNNFIFHHQKITKINVIPGSMSSNRQRMTYNRHLVSSKHLKTQKYSKSDTMNFKLNSLFNDFSLKTLLKAFIIIFPFFTNKNFLSFIKNFIIFNFKI